MGFFMFFLCVQTVASFSVIKYDTPIDRERIVLLTLDRTLEDCRVLNFEIAYCSSEKCFVQIWNCHLNSRPSPKCFVNVNDILRSKDYGNLIVAVQTSSGELFQCIKSVLQ